MFCGFDSLPNQLATRITKHFNIMVVGRTGSGKTSLINSLFDFDFGDTPDIERKKDVSLIIKEYRLKKENVESKFTIIESKGFNNQLNKLYSYQPIVDYIDEKYEEYLKHELNVQETRYNDSSDNRVHCCIYILPPDDGGLKPVDLIIMKHLQQRVCLIPVIGHSEILTKQEILAMKERIRQDISKYNIEIFCPEKYDLPFAIVASNDVIDENGKRQRIRSYSYGKLFIEEHNDFLMLKNLLFKEDMLALIETTNKVHYEKFRKEATSEVPKKTIIEFEGDKSRFDALRGSLLREIRYLEKEAY